MKEYGSNVQKLVDYLITVSDREKRTRYAHLLIELMKQIHPMMKDNQDYYNKLWDDLYIISGFNLDVDSPYPPPPKDAVGKLPNRVPYNTHQLRYRHYGRNLELLIDKAIKTEDIEDRKAFVAYIGKMMRSFYSTWNKDNVEESVVWEQLRELSGGRLNEEIEAVKREGITNVAPRDRYPGTQGHVSSGPANTIRQSSSPNNRGNAGHHQNRGGGQNNQRRNHPPGPGGSGGNNNRNGNFRNNRKK